MTTILWILGLLSANTILGASVWSSIDDKEQTLLEWFKSCPHGLRGSCSRLSSTHGLSPCGFGGNKLATPGAE